MTIRCKFRVDSVRLSVGQEEIHLQPVTTGSEENKSFAKYTPSGMMMFAITNPDLFEKFEPGAEFYIDLTAV